MCNSSQSSPEDARLVKRLQQFLMAGTLVSGSSSLGLLIIALFFPVPISFIAVAAALIQALLYGWAYWLVRHYRIKAAIISTCLGLWSMGILATLIMPLIFPVIALTTILPVIISLFYVDKPFLSPIIAISVGVSVIISLLYLQQESFTPVLIPNQIAYTLDAIFVPLSTVVIFWLLWHYRNYLDEIFAAAVARQAALQESEKRLALQVIESQTLAQQAQLLNRLASQIRNSLDLDTILETAVNEIRTLLKIDRCMFLWYRPHKEQAHWEVVKETVATGLPSFIACYPINEASPQIRKTLNLELLRVDDVSQLDDSILRKSMVASGYRSVLSLPIKTQSGDIGVVSCAHHRHLRRWSDGEVELLQAVVLQLAIAINQAELYNQSRLAAEMAQSQAARLEATLSELQHTQTQLLQSEKMSSLGQLVAGVAHEINNPVNFIYGNLHYAEEYAVDLLQLVKLYQQALPTPPSEIDREIKALDLEFLMEDLPKLMNSMRVGAERIREIVRSLRTFSRLDESEMKEVDIHTGIDSTLLILQNRLKTKPEYPTIKIIKQYGRLPKVECFPGQLNQVFMNLLINALDALEEDIEMGHQPSPWIQIVTEVVNQEKVAITITDNGPGMTEDVCAKLFNPFFTTKPVGQGTGLGLAICHSIVVEKHKGRLRCISARQQGTVFVIEIPVRQK